MKNQSLSETRRLCALGFIAFQCVGMSLFCTGVSASPIPLVNTTLNLPASRLLNSQFLNSRFLKNDIVRSGFEGQGRPRSRTSGGARGTCSERLVALLPGEGAIAPSRIDSPTEIEPLTEAAAETVITSTSDCSLALTSNLATTLEAYPTLWFHIPARDQTGITAELVLMNESQQAIAIDTMTLPTASGIIGIQLSHPLVTDQVYRWVFSILHYPNAPSQNPTVEGSLQRVAPDNGLVADLRAAQGTQARIQVLAQHNVWHDALHELAMLRRTQPNNATVTQAWVNLLDSVGLAVIADETMLVCCMN